MADLEIEGTFEEQWGTVKMALKQLHGAINGNGKEGLVEHIQNVDVSLAEIKAYGSASVFWGKVIAGLLGILIAALTLYFTSLEVRGKTTMLRVPRLYFVSHPFSVCAILKAFGECG